MRALNKEARIICGFKFEVQQIAMDLIPQSGYTSKPWVAASATQGTRTV